MLDEVSRLLPTLAKTNQRDEETLKAFGTLWDELSPRLSAAGSADGGGGDVRDGASGGGSGSSGGGGGGGGGGTAASVNLATVQETAGPLLEQLADPHSRLRHRLPLIGQLSRRFGATLLRRVATRLEHDAAQPGAPGLARTLAPRAAEIDRSLAQLIEPEIARE